MKKKICILTAKFGNGHIIASKGLSERFQQEGNETQVIDMTEKSISGKALKYCFENLPLWILEKIFYRSDTSNPTFFNLFLEKFLYGKKCAALLKQFSPDEVWCTFPVTTTLKKSFSGKIIVCITDYYSPHLSWLWGNPDHIICLDGDSKQRLTKYFPQYPKDQISIKPFPLPQLITQDPLASVQKKIQKEYLIPKYVFQKKILLFFFHGNLLKNEEIIIQKFQAHPIYSYYNFFILTGKNHSLKKKFQKIAKQQNSKNLFLFDWIVDIHDFYRITNGVIGKAGGAFVSEIIQLHIPFFISGTFSGQEKGNRLYLEKYFAHQKLNI